MNLTIDVFPNSLKEPFLITSQPTPNYNCIAWACEDDTKWYWPDTQNIYYWPNGIPREEKIENFILLFENLGYVLCNDSSLEFNYQKIAIYADAYGKPTHAARQKNNGSWTSKLGKELDIEHSIFSIDNGVYGSIILFMKKLIQLGF